MISRALEAEILRLYHTERWPIGTIATQLRVHHTTVRRVLAATGVPTAQKTVRPSMVEPYLAFIVETLTKFPTLRASRLYQMVRERGYPGAPDHFRAIVSRLRPRPAGEAYLRLRTLPGEQAQADWAHFGKLTIGRAVRPLMAFVMVLSYSRYLFLRFYLNAAMSNFLRGHVEAFAFFNSVPRVVLYDNLKSAVLERVGDAIRFHPTLLELAANYHFQPRPVAPARGNEKGRVERAICFAREALFAARRSAISRSQCPGACLVRGHRRPAALPRRPDPYAFKSKIPPTSKRSSSTNTPLGPTVPRTACSTPPKARSGSSYVPPSAAYTWACSPAACSSSSIPTALRPLKRPSRPRWPKTPRTSAPCATSSTGTRRPAPPLAVTLPDDPRLHALTVRPHALSDYEDLTPESTDERTGPHA